MNLFALLKIFRVFFLLLVYLFVWPTGAEESKTHTIQTRGKEQIFLYGLNNVSIITHLSCFGVDDDDVGDGREVHVLLFLSSVLIDFLPNWRVQCDVLLIFVSDCNAW